MVSDTNVPWKLWTFIKIPLSFSIAATTQNVYLDIVMSMDTFV